MTGVSIAEFDPRHQRQCPFALAIHEDCRAPALDVHEISSRRIGIRAHYKRPSVVQTLQRFSHQFDPARVRLDQEKRAQRRDHSQNVQVSAAHYHPVERV
jgi:hypothetical protein